MTRRTALATGSAMVVAGAATTTALAVQTAEDDAGLLELLRAWKRAEEHACDRQEEADKLSYAAYRQKPPFPDMLMVRNIDTDERRPMTRDDIKEFDRVHQLVWPKTSADNWRKAKLTVLEDWEAKCKAIEQRLGCPAASKTARGAWSAYMAIEDAIQARPANSILGVAVKLHIWAVHIISEDLDGGELAVLSAYRDARRLVQGFAGAEMEGGAS